MDVYKDTTYELLQRREEGKPFDEGPYIETLDEQWEQMTCAQQQEVDEWVRDLVERTPAFRATNPCVDFSVFGKHTEVSHTQGRNHDEEDTECSDPGTRSPLGDVRPHDEGN